MASQNLAEICPCSKALWLDIGHLAKLQSTESKYKVLGQVKSRLSENLLCKSPPFSDAIASTSSYPCQWASEWVSEWLIVSDLEIAIASPSFASLFTNWTFGSSLYMPQREAWEVIPYFFLKMWNTLVKITWSYVLCKNRQVGSEGGRWKLHLVVEAARESAEQSMQEGFDWAALCRIRYSWQAA